MSPCLLCGGRRLNTLLTTSPLPISHHFQSEWQPPELYPLCLLQCQTCAVVQLAQLPPPAALEPRFEWVRYVEPESHLDELAALLRSDLQPEQHNVGITYKDESLLQRLERLGYPHWHLFRGLETGLVDRLPAEWPGPLQLVVGRHVFEHSPSPAAFVRRIASELRTGGRLVLEVPDVERSMRALDYTVLWEEHSLYLTAQTMSRSLQRSGMRLLEQRVYPQAMEDSIVSIWTPSTPDAPPPFPALREELAMGARFGAEFQNVKNGVQRQIEELRAAYGPLALLGTGHLSCMFLHLMEIADYIGLVCDDHPDKQGLLFPGTRLRVQPSAELVGRPVCLLGVNPQNEPAVWKRQGAFLASGRFLSIFPASVHALEALRVSS